MSDSKVNHPRHYNEDPSGVECIAIVRHRTFNIGNAMKYLWRSGLKVAEGRPQESQAEDLNKALFYICDELHRLGAPVTCRHGAMVKALLSDDATASTVTVAPPATRKTTQEMPHTVGLPRWLRLQETVDDEDVYCRSCRCAWWAALADNPASARCAKCGVEIINLRGGGYKIVARETDKPEL